jgi:GTP-binding protein HflX
VPTIDVFNKIDRVEPAELTRRRAADPEALWLSARDGSGREAVLDRVAQVLAMDAERVHFDLNASSAADRQLMGELYRHARVVAHTADAEQVSIDADVPRRLIGRLRRPRVTA